MQSHAQSLHTPCLSRLISRRQMLTATGFVLAGAGLAGSVPSHAAPPGKGRAVKNGRIKQSVAQWCFETSPEKWKLEKTCQVARELGCHSVELLTADALPTVKQAGLTCAIVQITTDPDPPFLKGFNNPAYWPKIVKATQDAIEAAASFGCPNVICFTGYSARDVTSLKGDQIPKDEGARNCVEGFKKVVGLAEKKNVTLCLEMLNTREDSHPMKGHPGYQGDHTDYCIDIIKQVGSPRLKMLFDVYHVQVMDGDVIRRIRQLKDYIGHVHVAGNPGRGELDDKQEINFPPIMKALLEVGYSGYVGQEFIPTRNPYQSLQQAVKLCDVA
jgi:hydroxypyruvate isomerase